MPAQGPVVQPAHIRYSVALPGVQVRALTADLEKAFLQVSVAESDRDVLRFLWVEDIQKEHPELRALRFASVVFGVSSNPFLLNATLKYHLERYSSTHPNLVQRLLESTFVDDVVTGADTEDEAFTLYTQGKSIFRDRGFNLRKFKMKSMQLQRKIDRTEKINTTNPEGAKEAHPCYLDETYGEATLGDSHGQEAKEQKVLGVRWRSSDDRLVFDVSTIIRLASTLEPTKRNVISIISRF